MGEDLRTREPAPDALHDVVAQTAKRTEPQPVFAEGSAGMTPQAASRSSRQAVPDLGSSRAALVALVFAVAGFIAAAVAFVMR